MHEYHVNEENAYLQEGKLLFYKGELKTGDCLIVSRDWTWRAVIREVIKGYGFDIGVVDFYSVSEDGVTFRTVYCEGEHV